MRHPKSWIVCGALETLLISSSRVQMIFWRSLGIDGCFVLPTLTCRRCLVVRWQCSSNRQSGEELGRIPRSQTNKQVKVTMSACRAVGALFVLYSINTSDLDHGVFPEIPSRPVHLLLLLAAKFVTSDCRGSAKTSSGACWCGPGALACFE